MGMTHDEAWRYVAHEVLSIRAGGRTGAAATPLLGDVCAHLRLRLGYLPETWADLRPSQAAQLRERLRRAADRAMSAFIDAYAVELAGFVADHPDAGRPLPSYLRVVADRSRDHAAG